MDYLDLLKFRRSARKFTSAQLPQEHLDAIRSAACGAPVGSNMYKDIHLVVVQNRDILDKLAEASIKRWENKARIKEIIGSISDAALNRGLRDPFYGAPTVIFVAHRKQDVQPGIEYANVACIAFSMHLAATSLGLGSVLMWFALESMREIPELDHTPVLRLPDGFEPLLGIAIGYPAEALDARELDPGRISTHYL